METLYKALSPDLTCLGYQYEVGKLHKLEGEAEMCRNGFHACRRAMDVFNHRNYDFSVVYVCEGNVVDEESDKVVCDQIRLIRKIRPRELYSSARPTYGYTNHGGVWNVEHTIALEYIVNTAKYIPQWCIEEILLNQRAVNGFTRRANLRPYVMERLARHKSRFVRLILSERSDVPEYIRKIIGGSFYERSDN